MRKLIESTLVSLDGVIEAPERWANFDAEDAALSMGELGNYDAFVMGRVAYEKFFANWAHVAGNPYIDLINAMPKYVASRSLTEATWNATLLGQMGMAVRISSSRTGPTSLATPTSTSSKACPSTSHLAH